MAQKYGDPVYDNKTGKQIGIAKFDQNTGAALVDPSGGSSSDFMSAIQEKLLGQSGIISSTNSNLESRLNEAISGIQTGAEKSNQALESAYGRERAFQEGQGALGIQNQLEGRSGFATQMVAFRNLVETTDKNLKDLEQRKNELILQNDSAAASKISELQFKALEFQQQAQQQTFSNLLGIANFGLQSAQEKRLTEAQTFTEKKAINDIALEFGLDPTGKTLDQITQTAMVFASEDRKAKLAQDAANLKYTNAQTAKILTGDDSNKVIITPEITEKLAARWNELSAKGLTVDTSAEMENILGKYAKAGKEADFYDAIAKQASDSAKIQFEATKEKSTSNSNLFTNQKTNSKIQKIDWGQKTKTNQELLTETPSGLGTNRLIWGKNK